MILKFDESWLNKQKDENRTVINGDFYVESKIDLSEAENNWPGKLVIGDVEIFLMFEDDLLAKYGDVKIEKEIQKDNETNRPILIDEGKDGGYLSYTLKVTAGEYGAPDVKVEDTFTANKDYIESYEKPAEEGGSGTVEINENSMIWKIGDMQPEEVRTLTYRVKVKDTYIGASNKGTITNTAFLYSEKYEIDSDVSNFTPIAKGTLSKVAGKYTTNKDGSGTITYTIWVQADAKNTYTLDNVKIKDALDGSIDPGQDTNKYTDSKYRKYLSYDEESFKLYNGGSKNQNGAGNLSECENGKKPVFTDNDQDEIYNDSFTYEVGSLEPGESKTLVYSVKVAPGVFPVAGNSSPEIRNRAVIYVVDEREEHRDDQRLESYNAYKELSKKMWDRKLAGSRIDAETSVSMEGNVFEATGDSIIAAENPNSFTVPSGSFQYQVVANEAGDWDISSALMEDRFNNYMQFCGYVRVDAFCITGEAPSSDLTNEQVIADLKNNRTLEKTAWLKVDGKKEFSFTLQEIGLGEGNYAYLLTYYARPVNIEGVTKVIADNSFVLSGDVVHGNYRYTLPKVKVQASVTLEGGNNFSAKKSGWYYEKPKVTSGDFLKGALYWAIQVDGNVIPTGTRLKDITNIRSSTTHYIRGSSLAGIYKGNLGEQSIADYEDYEALMRSGNLTDLDTACYQVTKDNSSLTVQILKDIELRNNHSLYIIIKTEPGELPVGVRDTKTYNNALKSSFDGKGWIDHNTDSQVLYGNNGIFKELNKVLTWDGKEATSIGSDKGQNVETQALKEAGTYAVWQIQVNYNGNLSGRYRMEEQIPVGMELAYVRYHWSGPDYGNERPHTVQLKADGYEENVSSIASIQNYTEKVYYYTKDNTVFWDVDGLKSSDRVDRYGVEFQIACRVTNPEVLLGGQSRQFMNRVTLKNEAGKELDTSVSSVTIQRNTLTKSGTYNAETNRGRYPYKILINPLGEDLVEESDTITLVDEMSDTLILNTDSIQVMNTITGDLIEKEKWTAAVDGKILELELPDNIPLTITYEAIVNAPPGQSVSISNKAYWKGYTYTEDGVVSDEEFKYAVGGTVGSQETPRITILKKDQNNTSLGLADAEFKMQEVKYENETKTFIPVNEGWTEKTGKDGSLTFEAGKGQVMQFNTIYCLTETKAPDGYKLDAKPHYFVVAKQKNGVYPVFPEGVTVWYQDAHYIYQAYNRKGEITVSKEFFNSDNEVCAPIPGTYTFGLYETSEPEGEPLQTVTITYMNSDTQSNKTAVFRNLNLNKTYYVFELDDSNKPIPHGNAKLINKIPFIVSYHSGENDVGENGAKDGEMVTVTNRCGGPELPETGGTGTFPYTLGGLLLIAVGTFLLYKYKKRGKEEKAAF